MLDIIVPLFESEYVLHKELSIEEAMIPFKGHLSFKQYMKDKPVKWGIKVFALSDATNGYIYRMQIYTGKNMEGGTQVGLRSQVVLWERGQGMKGDFMTTGLMVSFLLLCGWIRGTFTSYPPCIGQKQLVLQQL